MAKIVFSSASVRMLSHVIISWERVIVMPAGLDPDVQQVSKHSNCI